MFWPISLPLHSRGYWWSISPLTGSLVRSNHNPCLFKTRVPEIVQRALSCCDEPYSCNWSPETITFQLSSKNVSSLEKMNSRLHRIGNKRFLLSYLYAGKSAPLFEDTKEAISAISLLPQQVTARADHCLQRSLLAAKTSKSFAKDGVLFIGASIASADMHAWIIEAGCQPDFEDRNWINFQPLLAIISI